MFNFLGVFLDFGKGNVIVCVSYKSTYIWIISQQQFNLHDSPLIMYIL